MAKRKTLDCPKCDRKFSMPAHLARHMSTTHGGKARGGSRKGKGSARRAVRASGVPRTGAPEGLLDTLQGHFDELAAQREAIDTQLEGIRRAIDAIGGSAPQARSSSSGNGRQVRGGRKGSLKDYIVRVLKSRSGAMSPAEIGTAVKQAGYKTKSDDLTKAVSNALPDTPGVKKIGRGQYRA